MRLFWRKYLKPTVRKFTSANPRAELWSRELTTCGAFFKMLQSRTWRRDRGFVTRGRGMTIHRTDCVNILHLSAAERERLIDAEWEDTAETGEGGQYLAELTMYAGDRQGLLMDVSRVFTEAKIDVKSMNIRTSKKGTATLDMGFIVHGREELNSVIEKLRQIESVMDIERTAG